MPSENHGTHDQTVEERAAALSTAAPEGVEPVGWPAPQPIDVAPKDGTTILAWWPIVLLDDDCMLTDIARADLPGAWWPSEWQGYWTEAEALDSMGSSFGDDCSYAEEPTYWVPMPPDVVARKAKP